MDSEKCDHFSIEKIKHLFHCLDNVDLLQQDQNLTEKWFNFLNNSSEYMTNVIYHPDSKDVESQSSDLNSSGKNKKLKISKTFQNGECHQETCDEFGNVLCVLSNYLEELQQDFQKNLNINDLSTSVFFVKYNLIQCELAKIKRFLSFNLLKNDESKSKSQTNLDSFQIYNNNIVRILNNRFLILQLLHLECIIFHYLKSIELKFFQQSNLSQDVVISQLHSLFRSYYTLLIKLSYETPFVQMIRILHRKSSRITTDILSLYFKIINTKFANNDLSNPDQQRELFDSILNNRSIVIVLDYITILNKIDLLSFKENIFKQLKFSNDQFNFDDMAKFVYEFLNNNKNILSPQINLVIFGNLILSHFCLIDKFMEKSSLRSRTIIMLFSVCRKLKHNWDRFSSALLLIPTIIKVLKRYKDYHVQICEGTLLNLEKENIILLNDGKRLIEKDKRLKSYMSILRDTYGILSLLLTFTECPINNQYLRFLKIKESFFEKFMHPFIYSLNGTENSDPETNRSLQQNNKIENLSQAYRILGLYRKQYDRIIHYSHRLVIMSSIFIQRLLPPLVLPIEDNHNPFCYQFQSNIQMNISQQSDDNDYDLDDENLFNFPGCSDEEYLDSQLLNESELDESVSDNNNDASIDSTFIKSYLCFFPETKFLKSKDEENIDNDNKLSCSCNPEFVSFPEFNKDAFSSKNSIVAPSDKMNVDDGFNWKETFTKEYNLTKSVIPRKFVPKPELNFVEQPMANGNHTMKYPFLERTIRYKNYSHIKLLDHVNERLQQTHVDVAEFPYELVYDVNNVDSNQENSKNDNFLKFESRFECGNLRKAFLKSITTTATGMTTSNNNFNRKEEEYILILNTDVNSSSHTQWFYFSVSQMKSNKRYRFKIINCEKKSILFNIGQQPLFYSCREFEKTSISWQGIGNNCKEENFRNIVAYYRNHYVKNMKIPDKELIKVKPYYTLEFTFTFPYDQDECYFAFNTPFSYSFLKTCIFRWLYIVKKFNVQSSESYFGENNDQIFFTSQTLCSTLKGNDLPLITITSNSVNKKCTSKHYVMITSRVHPAESNSSWILKGFIDFLLRPNYDCSNEQARKNLLNKYIFKIVPMINPDGVINGCTRTDLQAEDLNRHWGDASSILHPTIYHVKMLLQCLNTYSEGRNPVAFLDMHGHSRQHNIFSYSCFPMLSWKKSDYQYFHQQHLQNHICECNGKTSTCRLQQQIELLKSNDSIQENVFFLVPIFTILPLILQYQQTPAFDLESCSFVMQRDREQTARIVAWRQFGIPLSYTIECSASGCDKGPYAGQNLSYKQLEEMGQYLATSFNFINFLFCSQKHFPVIVWPREPLLKQCNQEKTIICTLLNRCVQSKNSDKPNSFKKQMIKQMLLNLYPDLKEIDSYFAMETNE